MSSPSLRLRVPGIIACIVACTAAPGCDGGPAAAPAASDAAVAVPDRGGLRLRLHAPVERPDLASPPAEQLRFLRRTVGSADEPVVGAPLSDGRLRFEPLGPDVATQIMAELRDASGVLLARAEGPVAVVSAEEPDRDIEALWLPVGAMVAARSSDGAPLGQPVGAGAGVTVLSGGRLLVSGGADLGPCQPGKPTTISAAATVLDPTAMRVEATWKLLDGRSHHGASALPGGRVALLGGYLAKAGVIGPNAGVELAVIHEARSEGASVELASARARFALADDGEQLWLVGGDQEGTPNVELFSIAVGTLATAPLVGTRLDPAAALHDDVRSSKRYLLVAGGRDGTGAARADGQIYEVKGQSLLSVGTLPAVTPTAADPAWLLASSPLSVWRLGGAASGGALADVRRLSLLDPLLQWQVQPSLGVGRHCMATAQREGGLWLFGGRDGDGAASDAVEVVHAGTERKVYTLGAGSVGAVAAPGPGHAWALVGGGGAATAGAPALWLWLPPE